MTPPHSNLPQWLHSLLESHPHSNQLEGRVTRLEVHREQQEDINDKTTERMRWLERGLQAVAVILLVIITRQTPSSAGAIADVLLAIIKR
jgi:hypothetical protein